MPAYVGGHRKYRYQARRLRRKEFGIQKHLNHRRADSLSEFDHSSIASVANCNGLSVDAFTLLREALSSLRVLTPVLYRVIVAAAIEKGSSLRDR